MTARQIAGILGVTAPTVITWSLPVCGTKGKSNLYDIKEAVAYYIKRAVAKQKSAGGSKEEEEILLMRARREKLEIQTAAIKGELIPADVVEGIWSEQIGYFKSSINSQPAKVGREICEKFGLQDQVSVEEIVRRSRDEALARMSEYDPSEYMRRAGASIAHITQELNEAEKAAIGVS